MVAGFFIFAVYWATALYLEWKSHRAMTIIENPEMSITEIPYPVITLCSTGNMINGKAFDKFPNKIMFNFSLGHVINEGYKTAKVLRTARAKILEEDWTHNSTIAELLLDINSHFDLLLHAKYAA